MQLHGVDPRWEYTPRPLPISQKNGFLLDLVKNRQSMAGNEDQCGLRRQMAIAREDSPNLGAQRLRPLTNRLKHLYASFHSAIRIVMNTCVREGDLS